MTTDYDDSYGIIHNSATGSLELVRIFMYRLMRLVARSWLRRAMGISTLASGTCWSLFVIYSGDFCGALNRGCRRHSPGEVCVAYKSRE
jgi:hypothetical protein